MLRGCYLSKNMFLIQKTTHDFLYLKLGQQQTTRCFFFSQKKSSLKKIKIKERALACGPELEAHMPKSFF
jgi:hypothetical protein